MRGCIRQRSKGSWQILYYVNGRQRSETIRGPKRDAEVRLTEILSRINKGDYSEPIKMTVSRFLNKWLEDCVKMNLTQTTYEKYETVVRLHVEPVIGHVPITSLKPVEIQDMHTGMLRRGYSPKSVLLVHRILNRALDQAVKWELVNRNPCLGVDPPKQEKRAQKVLSNNEAKEVLEAIKGTEYETPILLAIATGMRLGEICALTWDAVDLERGTAIIRSSASSTRNGIVIKGTKTENSQRIVSLPDFVVAHLSGLPRTHELVYCRPDGSPKRTQTISVAVARVLRGLGHDITMHGLRHTHASLLMREGIHPKVVAERLGHSSIQVTLDTYSHVLPSQQEGVAGRVNKALGYEHNSPQCQMR